LTAEVGKPKATPSPLDASIERVFVYVPAAAGAVQFTFTLSTTGEVEVTRKVMATLPPGAVGKLLLMGVRLLLAIEVQLILPGKLLSLKVMTVGLPLATALVWAVNLKVIAPPGETVPGVVVLLMRSTKGGAAWVEVGAITSVVKLIAGQTKRKKANASPIIST
jgi:hypothetical protein